jgi:hypothetical protein
MVLINKITVIIKRKFMIMQFVVHDPPFDANEKFMLTSLLLNA